MLRWWVRNFIKQHENGRGSLEIIRQINKVLAFQAVAMGALFLQLPRIASWPDEAFAWHIHPLQVEIWPFLFVSGGVSLLITTFRLSKVHVAHIALSVMWCVVGLLWITYGLLHGTDYVFGIGIISVFVSALHILFARLWRAEGVE